MIPSTNGLPTPLATLDDLIEGGDTSEKPVKTFIGHNLGNRTFLMMLPMHEFFAMSEVANDPGRDGDTIAQRKLDPAHASKLATYILKGLVSAAIEYRDARKQPPLDEMIAIHRKMGPQPYLSIQPIVVNIRDCNVRGTDIRGERIVDKRTDETSGFKVFLSQRHVLWVIDGQHRRMAMKMAFEFLEVLRSSRTYPKKGNLVPFGDGQALSVDEIRTWEECFERARTFCTIAIEVHLGLEPTAERQLFHDLNRLGKKVDTNLALQFDNSNPVNLFIKERLLDDLNIGVVENDVKNWADDDGRIARKDIVAINAILLLNRTNINGATPQMIEGRTETAVWFWSALKDIPGFGGDRAREKTVAAQPVVIKALAKLVFDFCFSNRRPADGDDLTEKLLSSLAEVDFSHQNPMWQYYNLSTDERAAAGLTGLGAYLPPEDDGSNRDVGSFQGGYMRFGAKHNDIYPLLGDMIRWKLGLPSRRG